MYAKVELNDEILSFIKKFQNHTESFEEIRELVFTKERMNNSCSAPEIFNLTLQFQEIKRSAINKVLKQQKLNFPEGFIFERLISKYSNDNPLSVEEHIKQIRLNCCNDRKRKRENNRKVSKLYSKFLTKLFTNNDSI